MIPAFPLWRPPPRFHPPFQTPPITFGLDGAVRDPAFASSSRIRSARAKLQRESLRTCPPNTSLNAHRKSGASYAFFAVSERFKRGALTNDESSELELTSQAFRTVAIDVLPLPVLLVFLATHT